MQRFYLVAAIYCFLVAFCLCDEDSDVNERAGNGRTGYVVEKNPNDPIYWKLAEEALQKYLQDIGEHRIYMVLQVTRATEQIVSGTLTGVSFLAAPTNCLVTGNITPLNQPCKVGYNDFSNVIACNSKIWDKTWLNSREISIFCTGINIRAS